MKKVVVVYEVKFVGLMTKSKIEDSTEEVVLEVENLTMLERAVEKKGQELRDTCFKHIPYEVRVFIKYVPKSIKEI